MTADRPSAIRRNSPLPGEAEDSRAAQREDERALLLRHRAGDTDAFAGLVEAYREPVYGYLVRCGVEPEERDDLFQEIFLRVHRATPSYQEDRPVHPFLFTIVCNTVRTHLRRRRVRQLIPIGGDRNDDGPPRPEPASNEPSSERRAAAREALSLVEKEIQRLPLAHREVLLLAGVDQLPLKDVAEILGRPVNTIKTHLRRARLQLAARLAEGGAP